MKLTDNIYVETGRMGANVGCVITKEGIVLIDTPQKPSDAVIWKKEVESRGKIKYIINTEGHADHFSGNFFFDVPIIAHEKARKSTLVINPAVILNRLAQIDPDNLSLLKDYEVNPPCITYSEKLTLHLGKHTFHLINLPGHTAGETAVFVPEERVIFTGDNITGKTHGFFHDSEPFAWLESLKRMGELDFDRIVPGHGDVVEKSYLAEQIEFVQGGIDTISSAIKQGMTKEEVVARITLPSRYPLQAGMGKRGEELLKMGVAHLYDVLAGKQLQ